MAVVLAGGLSLLLWALSRAARARSETH